MLKAKSITTQLVIMGVFALFLGMFFTLATSLYRDYKLEKEIEKFENEVNKLAEIANKKPADVQYFASKKYKDRYAKESLNLLNPGEKLIIIPKENHIIKRGEVEIATDMIQTSYVLELPNKNQWWDYFFGQTLSVRYREEVEEKPKEGVIDIEKIIERAEDSAGENEGISEILEG